MVASLAFSPDRVEPSGEDLALIAAATEGARAFTDPGSPHWNPRFVQSDGEIALMLLVSALAQLPLAGRRFGEWGSGLGLVSCLAARLGFAATGIEIDPVLVVAARSLAAGQGIAACFVVGSYMPEGFLSADVSAADAQRPAGGVGLFDFDLIYAYAWPAEAEAIRALFAANAAPGTVLLLYGGGLQVEALQA